MGEHTPTPWAMDDDGTLFVNGNRFDMVKLYTGWQEEAWLGDDEAIANAEFIVRAVNSHDDLVKALESAEEWLSGWASADPYIDVIQAALAAARTPAQQKEPQA